MKAMELDLAQSGLIPQDMGCSLIEGAERASINVSHAQEGYKIPYYDIQGKLLAHYRCKLFDSEIKYKQIKDTANHVYFPRNFQAVAKTKSFLIITEGEKKAALACKRGFPCVGLGGVDSWRNRIVALPENVELNQLKGQVQAKLPQGGELTEDDKSSLAIGMHQLIDFIVREEKQVIFIYDSDSIYGVKAPVQRAMSTLAFELRFRGVKFAKLRQVVLPPPTGTTLAKVGLDDFLLPESGGTHLQRLIDAAIKARSAFPCHPAIREFVGRKLQKLKLSRKEYQAVAIAILSDLDANGFRLRSTSESQTYYFDNDTKKLLKAEFTRQRDLHDTPFGQFLYRKYGLGSQDRNLIDWIASQFTGEEPIDEVSPHRILARISQRDDCVYYQASDSQYIKVDANSFSLHNNGEGGILFESDQVLPLDVEKVVQEYERQKANLNGKPLFSYWAESLKTVRLKDQHKQRLITTLLYYISPWLYRWRGMQLPVEMTIGESGSGKSSLYELRLTILNGQPRLRNAPADIKDWNASIANAGGLHVTDNVQLVDRNLRQRLSDEICRIITEPNPHIEMRKYYTNADLVRIPVHAVFALTAIQQPFQNADLIQRSMITELDKMDKNRDQNAPVEISYDAEWVPSQLNRYNGREGWVAHHLLALHLFFKLVQTKWQHNYQAKHRLINFEQSMLLMAEVLGIESSWLIDHLSTAVNKALAESDWTFEGLKTFISGHAQYYANGIEVQAIADWAGGSEDYNKCEILISGRRLYRYMQQHKTMIASILGLIEVEGDGRRKQVYKVISPKLDQQKVVEGSL